MTFAYFTDRDLGRRFPQSLRDAGLVVHAHDEHFGPATPDAEWIRAVSHEGWVVLTHDRRIQYKPNERRAVALARISLLVLVGKATPVELARNFVHTLPRIEAFLEAHRPPLIAGVYRPSQAELRRRPDAPGRIELRWPTPGRRA
ncbi:MAG: hypothetical protein R3B35_12255 [Gemmatimonadales bacterium]